jgi:hypothetical protein
VRRLALALALLQAADPQPEAPAVRGADLSLLHAVRKIAGRVSEIHGEPFDRPPLAVRATAELRQAAAEIRALDAVPRERLQARGRAWVDLGLGSSDSPAHVYAVLAADLDGIGFDPQGNRLLVDPERLTEADFEPDAGDKATVLMSTGVRPDEPVVGHMLVHVRQLERSHADWLAQTTDETLARAAWAEAEANLLALRYLFAGVGLADAAVAGGIDPKSVLDGRLVPKSLDSLPGTERELVRFVYEDGFDAGAAAFRRGGFAEVARAGARARTTAELLRKSGPPPPSAAPAPEAPPEGLVVADEDTLGAHGIFVLVATATGKDDLGLQAASGWIGDRVERLEPRERAAAERGVTRWDVRFADETGASDFEYALVRTLEARFPGRRYEKAESTGTLLAGERVYRIERKPTAVRIVVEPSPQPAKGGPGR